MRGNGNSLRSVIQMVRWITWFLIALAAAYLTYSYGTGRVPAPSGQSVTQAPLSVLEGDFKLTTQTGASFSAENFTEKPSVVFFGFTNCPDICPTGLFELSDLLARLGGSAGELQAVFIAVDSNRDTQSVVREYLTSFDSRIVGLTGSKEEIDRAVKTLKAYYEVILGSGPDSYTVNHSAGMFLIDKQKRFVGKLDSHESMEVRLRKLQLLIKRGASGK